MSQLLHQLISHTASRSAESAAVFFKNKQYSYGELNQQVDAVAAGLLALGLKADDRVATYLPKLPENVFALFGASRAGGVFVPVNPLLKPRQVAYILKDCNVRVLITSAQRFSLTQEELQQCPDLEILVVVEDQTPDVEDVPHYQLLSWPQLCAEATVCQPHSRIDADMAAILYTSGSTGNPKGVVLSHKNMVTGAHSVALYLNNTARDKLLAVLPLSFDYGFSQLTTAFSVGASVVLMDYLLPRDIIRAIAKHNVTGLAAVPPIWNQLIQLAWPPETVQSLRYLTNSGGAMPQETTQKLQQSLPNTDIYLMYGLTEAFRSTYLPPDQVAIRPDSMGKAIPNAEIAVVRPDGTECEADEPGELVHRGSLVAMGYWNDKAKTAERFKPAPGRPSGLPMEEVAVWSGDQVRRDEEGYLYFISRLDEMIKTSGYRVSPTEVEAVIYRLSFVKEAAAIGPVHPSLGQAIVLIVSTTDNAEPESCKQDILNLCKRELPNFMVPQAIIVQENLPHNQNGKIDRKALAASHQAIFSA